jgi:L-threonylcarbamoyladenylate synthase
LDCSHHFAPSLSKYAIWGKVFGKSAEIVPLPANARGLAVWQSPLSLMPKVVNKYNLQVGPIVNTDLIAIDQDNPHEDALLTAAAAIRRGEVVAIPTDALYVLVADPYNLHAIGKVFLAKGREIHRSLPLLITDTFMAEDLAKELNSRFYQLSRHFWPGPLTIIVPAGEKVPLKVTGNTGRLALRQVRTPVAMKLVEILQQPIIATSANISGQPTCKTGIEVFGTMDGRLKLVLDGGGCVGTGSTTVDITEPYWRIIKEGAITEKQIAEVLHAT